jgi:hypothetical protein
LLELQDEQELPPLKVDGTPFSPVDTATHADIILSDLPLHLGQSALSPERLKGRSNSNLF